MEWKKEKHLVIEIHTYAYTYNGGGGELYILKLEPMKFMITGPMLKRNFRS